VPTDVLDDRIQQQQQQLLKDHMFEQPPQGVEAVAILSTVDEGHSCHTVYLATIITETPELSVTDLASMMYDLSKEIACSNPSFDDKLLAATLEGEPDNGDELPADWEPDNVGNSSDAWEPFARDLLDAESLIERIRSATLTDSVLQQIIECKEQSKQRLPYKLIHEHNIKVDLAGCSYRDGLLYVRDKIFVRLTTSFAPASSKFITKVYQVVTEAAKLHMNGCHDITSGPWPSQQLRSTAAIASHANDPSPIKKVSMGCSTPCQYQTRTGTAYCSTSSRHCRRHSVLAARINTLWSWSTD
jgi:hypothetical protein